MRRVLLGMNVTCDGFVAGPDGEIDWLYPQMDAELCGFILDVLSGFDTLLMGRVTYQNQAERCQSSTDPVAAVLNKVHKVVFSRTLSTVDWSNARLAANGPVAEIARLKQEPGGPIGVAGGSRFAQTLLARDLVDQLELTVHPVVLGCGAPLFVKPMNLQLLDERTFASGVVHLTYRPI